MKQYKLTFTMPDSFETGECFGCPLGIDDGDGDYHCIMHYRFCDCPLHETQAVEEEYID